VHKRIISAVNRVEFVSAKMSYILLRGRWCHVIVLNVHEDKTDDVKDSFYEELEHVRVFDKFPKHHTNISLRDLNVKVVRENTLKQTTEKQALTRN
jgi:ribosome-interacting GTPase 1